MVDMVFEFAQLWGCKIVYLQQREHFSMMIEEQSSDDVFLWFGRNTICGYQVQDVFLCGLEMH